ncbi:hypothetical protein [Mycolicibacterium psychrotolerans]|uniref:Uncharacterized protein n=1 Tax=Mycolicibacterium psychrotolerans TaxID=216929 RepID=A0A7I7MAV7_9MYCO|nr:hypothetical protein [Mycolicibacterium psychrotolerans]KRE29051.1 hypothetical protein ASG82_04745 [Mycobacterium sp. Soil538]BBX68479.1 hypothetical protein MPSYJ_19400 [Mycolicibacterium psychrotolerans]
MRRLVRCSLVAVAGVVVTLGSSAVAGATPKCTDVGKTVTWCETNGSTQLTATPPPWNWGGWQGGDYYPFGAFGFFP